MTDYIYTVHRRRVRRLWWIDPLIVVSVTIFLSIIVGGYFTYKIFRPQDYARLHAEELANEVFLVCVKRGVRDGKCNEIASEAKKIAMKGEKK